MARLVRQGLSDDAASGELPWRPAGTAGGHTGQQWPPPGHSGRPGDADAAMPRVVTDDFSASGAFLSLAESQQRLGGAPPLAIDTLRIHDADTAGGPGAAPQASGALAQARSHTLRLCLCTGASLNTPRSARY